MGNDLQTLASKMGALDPNTGCTDFRNTPFADNLQQALKSKFADLGSAEINTLTYCPPTNLKLEAQIHWKHHYGNFLPDVEDTFTISYNGDPLSAQICVDLPLGFGSPCMTAGEVAAVIAAALA